MKTKKTVVTLATFVMFLFTACTTEIQNKEKETMISAENKIEVIQFHSAHRCMTCNLIEELSKEALKSFPEISFTLINVDDEKNYKMAEAFEATGTALFLYNPATQKKVDLTDFAFMNAANNPEVFKNGLKKEIEFFK